MRPIETVPMTRPARIYLHGACICKTLQVRHANRWASLRWHGYDSARALFCGWITPDVKWTLMESARLIIAIACAVMVALMLYAITGGR